MWLFSYCTFHAELDAYEHSFCRGKTHSLVNKLTPSSHSGTCSNRQLLLRALDSHQPRDRPLRRGLAPSLCGQQRSLPRANTPGRQGASKAQSSAQPAGRPLAEQGRRSLQGSTEDVGGGTPTVCRPRCCDTGASTHRAGPLAGSPRRWGLPSPPSPARVPLLRPPPPGPHTHPR